MKGKGIYIAISALLGTLTALLHLYLMVIIFFSYISLLYRYKPFSKPHYFVIVLIFPLYFIVAITTDIHNKTVLNGTEEQFAVHFFEWETDGDLLQITGEDQQTKEKLLVRYYITSINEKNVIERQMRYGLRCNLSGQLQKPQTARNPNSFDYQRYLATKGVHWILEASQNPLSNCSQPTPSFFSYMDKIRSYGINKVKVNFPEPIGSLAIALLFGERTIMNSDLVQAYERIGIVHLLAISGLQVSFLTGVLYFVGIRIGVMRETMIDVLLVFLPCYALLTGATPSVVRAVVMMLVILFSMKLGHHRLLPLDALSLAFLLVLLCSPYLVFDVGFQLSFCASGALLLSTFLLKDKSMIGQLLLTSYIAQLATLPIILYNFYEFSLLSLIANVIFVPFFSVFLTPFLFFVFILYPLPLFGFLCKPMVWVTNQIIILVNFIIEVFSTLPFHIITLGRPELFILLFYTGFICFIFYKLEGTQKNLVQSCLLIFLPITMQLGINMLSPYGEVTFIDVGQGDAILIKLPNRQGNILIDTGGRVSFSKDKWQERHSNFEVGEDIVLPYLKSKGVTTIDKLILTHGDFDHIGGARAIIEGVTVKEIVLPKVHSQAALEMDLMKEAEANSIPVTFVSAGDSFGQNGNLFRVLTPLADVQVADKNDHSIVLYAQLGGLNWLFTGDLEKEGEKELVKRYEDMDVNVLKVAHHGSDSSTTKEFLTAFQPEIAVISVGEKNRYGHPHKDVISRLEERQIKIFRTDQNGAVSYIFKGKRGTFSVRIP